MKIVFFTTFLIFVLVLIIPGILGIAIHKIPSGFQPQLNNTEQLFGPKTISQTFVAKDNFLSGFALTLKNPNLENKKDITMSLSENGMIVRQLILNGRSIPDGGYINFAFAPINDSANKTYTAFFVAPDSTTADALELYHSDQNFSGEYKVNDEVENGSLSFVTYYAPKNIIANLGLIYGNWLGKFFQDLPFAVFFIVILLFSGSYLVKEFSKKKI